MRISIHQYAALIWLFASSAAFAPILVLSPKPNVGVLLWLGIATVTAAIAMVPILLNWAPFRTAFCWTDAFTPQERKLLVERRVMAFYQVAYDGGYVARVKPYILRVAGVMALQTVPELMSWKFENAALQSVLLFSSWYAGGVFMLIAATLPWPQIGRQVFQKNP